VKDRKIKVLLAMLPKIDCDRSTLMLAMAMAIVAYICQ
jgi:hypothetical protein